MSKSIPKNQFRSSVALSSFPPRSPSPLQSPSFTPLHVFYPPCSPPWHSPLFTPHSCILHIRLLDGPHSTTAGSSASSESRPYYEEELPHLDHLTFLYARNCSNTFNLFIYPLLNSSPLLVVLFNT